MNRRQHETGCTFSNKNAEHSRTTSADAPDHHRYSRLDPSSESSPEPQGSEPIHVFGMRFSRRARSEVSPHDSVSPHHHAQLGLSGMRAFLPSFHPSSSSPSTNPSQLSGGVDIVDQSDRTARSRPVARQVPRLSGFSENVFLFLRSNSTLRSPGTRGTARCALHVLCAFPSTKVRVKIYQHDWNVCAEDGSF